MAISH